ncbi:hypothetical protein N9K16_00350 [Alphaproteobacteria bacterium]|nr:hypothetical protein [Alphaproteobacteria bacterium]
MKSRFLTLSIKALSLFTLAVSFSTALSAEQLQRFDSVTIGRIKSVSASSLWSREVNGHITSYLLTPYFVTATKDAVDKLRMKVWRARRSGKLEERSQFVSQSTIKSVDVAGLLTGIFVTAVIKPNNKLQLTSWRQSSNGRTLTKLNTTTSSTPIKSVSIARGLPGTATIVAKRTDNRLTIATFSVDDEGSFSRLLATTTGEIKSVVVAGASHQGVAARNKDGDLAVTWMESALRRRDTSRGQKVEKIAVAGSRNNHLHELEWFTLTTSPGPSSVRKGLGCTRRLSVHEGRAFLTGWRLEHSGDIKSNLVRSREFLFTDHEALASEVALTNLANPDLLVTAHLGKDSYCRLLPANQGNPRLRLVLWDIYEQQDRFVKLDEGKLGGEYKSLDIVPLTYLPTQNGLLESQFVVVLRDKNDQLKLSYWRVNN